MIPFFDYRTLEQVVQAVRGTLPESVVTAVDHFVASFDTSLLWNDLAELEKEMTDNSETPYFAAGSAVGVTSMMSVGYVLWTIRSGWLVTSLLAQMPAWRLVDPLVVLDYLDDETSGNDQDGEEDDSIESLLEESAEHEEESPETVAVE